MEHCMIDNKRCSKCCEVLTLQETKNAREWRRWFRFYNNSDNIDNNIDNNIFGLIRKISKRRAKKINPRLVKRITDGNKAWRQHYKSNKGLTGCSHKQMFFTCRNYINSSCADYQNRPETCSGYPYYERLRKQSKEDFKKSEEYKRGGLYTIDCTFFTTEQNA